MSYLKGIFRHVLFGVDFPPEPLAEILRLAADALQVIEVRGRNLLKNEAHARHGDGRESILCAGVVQVPHKKAHEFAAFGLATLTCLCFCHLLLKLRKIVAN